MGMRLSAMSAIERPAVVVWQHESVDFCYRPGIVTIDYLDNLQAKGEDGEATTVAQLLAPVLVWWDVLDEEDRRIPVTEETLRSVALSFNMAILAAIREDNDNPPA